MIDRRLSRTDFLATPTPGPWALGTLYGDEIGDALFRFVRNVGTNGAGVSVPLVPGNACFYAGPNGFRRGEVVAAGTTNALDGTGAVITVTPVLAAGHTLYALSRGECGFIQVYGLQTPPVASAVPTVLQNGGIPPNVRYPVGCRIQSAISAQWNQAAAVDPATGQYVARGLGRQVAVLDQIDMDTTVCTPATYPFLGLLRLCFEQPL